MLSPNSKKTSNFCPTLKKYNVDLEEPRLHEALLRDLVSLNRKHQINSSNALHKHLLSYETVGKGERFYLVEIPASRSLDQLDRQAREKNWVQNLVVG